MRHSAVHRFWQLSFHAGTWCMVTHTALEQASEQASRAEVPQTVTQVPRGGSYRRRQAGILLFVGDEMCE